MLWVVTPCSLVDMYERLEESDAYIFRDPERPVILILNAEGTLGLTQY
jgi:hypothetical protein